MTVVPERLQLDERGTASLDGRWEFYPGDHDLAALDGLDADEILVPGLWEAQGWLELDGYAWYRRGFSVQPDGAFWTLRFGAVMDVAEVFVNGELVGTNDSPFTPFELDVTSVLARENVLAVRVFDPSLNDPEHIRLAHGKQGWANHHFPSRPSLYMTYGGIWQPVTLRRHGPLVIADIFVEPDPDDVRVTVEIENRAGETHRGRVGIRALGDVFEEDVELAGGEARAVVARLGATAAARWTPERPVLHAALADVVLEDEAVSHSRRTRFGLRTVRVDGHRVLLNETPYRMKSVLVQGFRADGLYAEGSRAAIEDEVRAARELGFNTLRLHIKAFEPTYLDVCDELGMLLHCDLPVAEPVAHDELGDDTVLARRCVFAVEQQIRRDRNHPSIVLWSAMNELCLDRLETRYTKRYERFARALAAAVERTDPTRPYIENDWIEPEPEQVFRAPVLTAHWYGRLHAEYLARIDEKSAEAAVLEKPFFVTEYGDWGLPDMPQLTEPPFWDPREVYAAGLAKTLWPGTIPRFILETHRYQGLSDRLQTEVFRRHGHISGYCLTELTDVPHELNGLLDLYRRQKGIAAAEMRRANQTVLPMLRLESLVVEAGTEFDAPLWVANDGPGLREVEIEARLAESVTHVRATELPAYDPALVGGVRLTAPEIPGSHDLVLLLRSGGRVLAENRYPIHVVHTRQAEVSVRLLGGDAGAEQALSTIGARIADDGPVVVAEDGLSAAVGAEARAALDRGETVLMLAQRSEHSRHYPVPAEISFVQTKWGSSVFHFTTDDGALTALPRRAVLVAEDSTVQARNVVARIDGRLFPDFPVVIAYKPVPSSLTATVVGAHRVGSGRLIFCQYRLVERARRGDAAARALLADLVLWAAGPRRVLRMERADGGSAAYYAFDAAER